MKAQKMKRIIIVVVCVAIAVIAVIVLINYPTHADGLKSEAAQNTAALAPSPETPAPWASNQETPSAQEAAAMEEYGGIQATELQLRNICGRDAIFPEFYRIVKGTALLGYSEDEAIEQAKEDLLKREAMYQYVAENGYDGTDAEVERHIETVVAEIPATDNYDEINGYYEKAGITIEDAIRGNFVYYKRTLAIKKYIDAASPESVEAQVDPETGEGVKSELENLMATLEANAMEMYSKTAPYEKLSKALDDMAALIAEGNDDILSALTQNEKLAKMTYESLERQGLLPG